MANIRIAYPNYADDDATVDSGTSEATGYERDYLMAPWRSPGYTWRSTSTAQQNVQFDLGSSKAVSCVAVWNHNLTSSATIRVQGDDNSTYASPTYDVLYDALDSNFDWANAGDEQPFFIAFFSAVTERYWRVQITDASNPDGYMSFGRIFIGSYWTPTVNMSYGYNMAWTDPTKLVRGPGGVLAAQRKPLYRTLDISFRGLTTAEAEELLDMRRTLGKDSDVIVSAYPGDASVRERQSTVIGHVSKWSNHTHSYLDLNSTGLTVVESL